MNNFLHKLFGTTPGKGVQPKEAVAYSIAGFGENFICTIIGSYLTIFMTDALLFGSENFMVGAISGTMAVAFLMLGVRIFDACNDPIMGSIVDKTRTKWGKCRPFLKWTVFPIGIITLLCFLPVYRAESIESFIAIACIYTVWSVVYTIADVPYWGRVCSVPLAPVSLRSLFRLLLLLLPQNIKTVPALSSRNSFTTMQIR